MNKARLITLLIALLVIAMLVAKLKGIQPMGMNDGGYGT
jgi:hypothetical protein